MAMGRLKTIAAIKSSEFSRRLNGFNGFRAGTTSYLICPRLNPLNPFNLRLKIKKWS